MSDDTAEPEVLFERRGRVGSIHLNRPRAINALTHGMVIAITDQLTRWRTDDAVTTVLLTGAGERGLCAGGDIVGLYRSAVDGTPEVAAAFWRDEYQLNALIARYPKPFVAVMDGIVLGGGIGLAAHGSHRIVTERSALGLPEVGIGFVPDVGATWLLSRAPGESGTHLALTAGSIGAADAIHVGLADSMVRVDDLAALAKALETDDPDVAVARFETHPGGSSLAADGEWIEAAYAADDLQGVLDGLDGSSEPGAEGAAATIRAKSPTAVAVTLESLRRARGMGTLEAVLAQEFAVSVHALLAPDFAEGVRAQVIDKDRNPRWSPAEPPGADVVAGYFEPVADGPQFEGQRESVSPAGN